MELLGEMQQELYERLPLGYGGRFYGVYPALVTDLKDPDNLGRVEVTLPWSPDSKEGSYKVWARIATLMAGKERGSWFIPDLDDEVLICFEGGDPRKPFVMGGLWNGQDTPPEAMDEEGKNEIKSITSRTKVKITMDDTEKKQRLVLETPATQKLTFQDDTENEAGYIELDDSNGNQINLSKDGIAIKTTKEERPVIISDVNGNEIKLTKDGITITDKQKNTVVMSNGGITVTDKEKNKIEMTSSGIKLTDKDTDTVTMSGGEITVKNRSQQTVKLSTSGVVTTDAAGKATVSATGVSLESPPGKLSIGPANATLDHVAGVTAQSGPTMVKLGPDGAKIIAPTGVTIMAGANIIKADPSGISLLAATMLTVTAPLVSFTAPMVSFAGVVQCTTLIAPTIAGGAYTPGGGNML